MSSFPTHGGCACSAVRFELRAEPLFTHACHCFDCRRRSGAAFGLTTFVLREDFAITQGRTVDRKASPRSTMYYCPGCMTYLYSSSTAFPRTLTVRGGAFDDASVVQPGAHIWVKRKHEWVALPDVPQFDEGYPVPDVWPAEALARMAAN